jgi:hypothetical protein
MVLRRGVAQCEQVHMTGAAFAATVRNEKGTARSRRRAFRQFRRSDQL